jgi:hypothetical protein
MDRLRFAASIDQPARSFAMTPLRQRMLEDMSIRNLAPNTQQSYLQQVSSFARTPGGGHGPGQAVGGFDMDEPVIIVSDLVAGDVIRAADGRQWPVYGVETDPATGEVLVNTETRSGVAKVAVFAQGSQVVLAHRAPR